MKPLVALVMLALGLQAAGCGRSDPDPAIGFAFPQWGQANIRVIQEELDAIPDAGPTLVLADGEGSLAASAEDEVRLALRLLAVPGLVGVVGHGGSRGSLVAAPLYNEAGVVQIVPTGTSAGLLDAGPWTLMMAPVDSVIADRMAAFAADRLGAARAAICFVGEEYGYGMDTALEAACRARGIEVLDAFPLVAGARADDLVALSLERGRPDVVFLALRDQDAGRVVAAYGRRSPGLRFVGSDGIELNSGYFLPAGAHADSLYVVTFWHESRPDSVSQAFVERFRRLNGYAPFASNAMRHDAAMVLAAAVRATGGDREAVREWLCGLGVDRPPHPGVTGPISFVSGREVPLVFIRKRGERVVTVPAGGGPR